MDVVSWRDESPGVVVLSMERRPANALGLPILDGIHSCLDALEERSDVKVLVLESVIDGFFAAGADIKHLSTIDAQSFLAYGERMRSVNDRLAAAAFISIAALDGVALGGGLELALACTVRVAGPGARLGLPEVRLGLIPGAGGTQRLPRLVGRGRALDIMLSARQVEPEEALRIGLVDRVGDRAIDTALSLAVELTSSSLPALLAVVATVDAAGELPLAEGLSYEVQCEQSLFEDGEAAEGISAFLAKRSPRFA